MRLEPGSRYRPAIGDDIEMQAMDWPTAKAFADPSEAGALLWARWGGSSFEKEQWRCYTTNPYDAALEATLRSQTVGAREYISYSTFLALLDPNFPRKHPKEVVSREDADALLQRMHVVL